MKISRNTDGFKLGGVPDYYLIYLKWINHYEATGEDRSKTLAFYYAQVAKEMGQAIIEEEDITNEDLFLDTEVTELM